MNLFSKFVAETYGGSQSRAADALHCGRSLVCRLCHGSRAVTPAMARRIEELSGGRFSRESFIWPESKAV